MHLIDEQDDVVGLGGLRYHALQALLELAAIFRTGHQPGQVERPDVLAHEVLGDVAGGDLLRQPLDDGGLAHTGVTQDERVVLGTARKDLHHAGDLLLSTDDRIEFALARLLREVGAELRKHALRLATGLTLSAAAEERQTRTRTTGAGARQGTLPALVLGRELLHGAADARARDAQAAQDVHSQAVALAHDGEQQMLRGDIGLVVLARQAEALLHHRYDERRECELGVLGLRLRRCGLMDLVQLLEDVVVRDLEIAQRLGRHALLLLGQGEQQMLGADLGGLERSSLLFRKRHDLARSIGESVQHASTSFMLVACYRKTCTQWRTMITD